MKTNSYFKTNEISIGLDLFSLWPRWVHSWTEPSCYIRTTSILHRWGYGRTNKDKKKKCNTRYSVKYRCRKRERETQRKKELQNAANYHHQDPFSFQCKKCEEKRKKKQRHEVAVSTLVKTKTTHAGIVLPPRRPAGTDVTHRSWEKSDGRHRRRHCSRALRCANTHGTCRSATHVRNIPNTVKIRHDSLSCLAWWCARHRTAAVLCSLTLGLVRDYQHAYE